MVRSMFSGVSGLRAHQTMMDTIGNNIANVNTYGFKASRTTFRDVYYQTLNGATAPAKKGGNNVQGGSNPNQVGYGAAVNTIDTLMTQSGFSFTDNGLDVSIAGEGFFQVQTPDGSKLYTRAGILDIDANGNVVDAGGNFVLGVNSNMQMGKSEKDPATGAYIINTSNTAIGFTTEKLGNNADNKLTINVNFAAAAANPTLTVTEDGTNVTTAQLTLTLQEGKSYTQAEIQELINTAVNGLTGTNKTAFDNDIGNIKFESDGNLTGAATDNTAITLTTPDVIISDVYNILGDPNSGSMEASTSKINILDKFNQVLKAAGKPEATNSDFKSITISKTGEIVGNHATYGLVTLGRLDIATFSNPRGLQQSGNNYFSETGNSGSPKAVIPGYDGGGSLVSGALELSNVDLSKEMSNMITTQRGFQANSRIITVSDTMLEELINLKR